MQVRNCENSNELRATGPHRAGSNTGCTSPGALLIPGHQEGNDFEELEAKGLSLPLS